MWCKSVAGILKALSGSSELVSYVIKLRPVFSIITAISATASGWCCITDGFILSLKFRYCTLTISNL